MPKKFPQQNSKAVEANARKTAAKEAKQQAEDKAKEDAYWADDDKHVKKKEERKVSLKHLSSDLHRLFILVVVKFL